VNATLRCLTGRAIGELLGMVIGTALGRSGGATIALAVGLAFLPGYPLTIAPVLRSGLPLRAGLTSAADTVSIPVMEIADNGGLLLVPGRWRPAAAHSPSGGSLASASVVAFVVTLPANRWLLARGEGRRRPPAPLLRRAEFSAPGGKRAARPKRVGRSNGRQAPCG
jgi:hypothetical protein